MRTSTAAAFLLLCVVGSTFALTYEESKRMSMRRHQSLEAAATPAAAAEGNMLETILSTLQNSKLIDLIKLIIAASNTSSGLLGDSLDSNQTILQNIVDGFYEENNLADPSTLVACVDPTDAALIVSFLPTFLSKASSLLTISAAITAATNLASQLNPDVLTCLESNSEALELGTVYDVSAIQPAAAISYLTSHVSTFVGEFSTLNKLWNQKNFNGLGNNAAAFAHTVINSMSGVHSTKNLSDSLDANQTILQNIVDGFYEENNLADPSTLVACVDPTDAALIVSFLPTFLSKASSLLTISAAITAATNLASQLNPDVLTCLESNSEALELGSVYDVSAIQPAAAISYLTSHVSAFVGEFSTLNKLWNQKNFNGLGNNAAAFAHTVINSMSGIHSSETLTNWEIMQQYYNGFYAQQNLPNPTYIAKCYNDNAVADFVAFEPTFLKKASSVSTIADAFANLETFNNEQAAKYPEINICLEGNEEIAALQVALGIKHPETVNDTVKAYINANLFSTTSEFGTASKSWNSASYSNSGKQVSAWTKKSLAKN